MGRQKQKQKTLFLVSTLFVDICTVFDMRTSAGASAGVRTFSVRSLDKTRLDGFAAASRYGYFTVALHCYIQVAPGASRRRAARSAG